MDLIYGRALRFFLSEGGQITPGEIDQAAQEIATLLINGIGEVA